MTVEIKHAGNDIIAHSDYHPDLPRQAKKLGGRWNSNDKCWIFDVRDEERVRELYRTIYGTDGTIATGDMVNMRVTVKEESDWAANRTGLYFAGRCVARATGRDSGAKLGNGVIVLEGGFDSGGSMKNWKTRCDRKKTVFEIRDVPREKALEAVEDAKDDKYIERVEIIENQIDVAKLENEKKMLLARIAEIDNILNNK
jgi:hypothetical protein